MEQTRRHLALVKRKREKVSEALEIAAVHRLPAGHANECVLKVPRTFSQWSANNAAKKIGEFLDAAAGRAEDDAEGVRLQRHVASKLTDATSPLPIRSAVLRPVLSLRSDGCVREWRGYAKEELGVEQQVLEGKIVTAAVPIGTAVANRIWDLRWSAKREILDLLHINLRITAGLYYYTVQRHCTTPEDLRQWMFDDELGITVNSKKRQNKKHDDVSSIGQKKESFIGA
eukprot:jgi/Tetstr1/445749/TSEL_033397.t1